MRLFFIAVLVSLFNTTSLAQTPQVSYFDKDWERVASPDEARYSRTVTIAADSTTTTEERDLKNGRLLRRKKFKGDEPWGRQGRGKFYVDYSFPLVYDEAVCADSIAGLQSAFADDTARRYTAPVLAEDQSLYAFLSRVLRYPDREREAGISGKVYMAFSISADGVISDVHVARSSGFIGLDKEAVRALRLMRFKSGPMQDGKPRSLCARQPLTFRIDGRM